MARTFGCLCLSFITMEMNSPAPTKQIMTATFPEGKLIMLRDRLKLAYLVLQRHFRRNTQTIKAIKQHF